MPAKYNDEAEVHNSIIADGCIIEGTVENSVRFRGVVIKKGAYIKDSIIMQGSTVISMIADINFLNDAIKSSLQSFFGRKDIYGAFKRVSHNNCLLRER